MVNLYGRKQHNMLVPSRKEPDISARLKPNLQLMDGFS
jgi:hypothetical protein